MARPVKWSRDLHVIRERAVHSRTETWSRVDIERLFSVGRATAQTLMKAIGEVQAVGAAHFIDRPSLLSFLNAMIEAPSVDEALRTRILEAAPPPKPKTMRSSLPGDLRNAMMPNLPSNILLGPGRLEIMAETAEAMLESLIVLALIMQNDLDRFAAALEPPPDPRPVNDEDEDMRKLFDRLRADEQAREARCAQ